MAASTQTPSRQETYLTIAVLYHLNDEPHAAAITGVVGPVTDLLLPAVGDLVSHCGLNGVPFLGRVTNRLFAYDLVNGVNIDGNVTITISLDRVVTH